MSFTVAIDFDGTLCKPTGRQFSNIDLGIPMPGAQQFVQRLVQSGALCYVHSVRANTDAGHHAIREWLKRYGFPPLLIEGKPAADVYLDDRGIRFSSWTQAYSEIVRQRGRESK